MDAYCGTLAARKVLFCHAHHGGKWYCAKGEGACVDVLLRAKGTSPAKREALLGDVSFVVGIVVLREEKAPLRWCPPYDQEI